MYAPIDGGSEIILQDDGKYGQKGSLAVKAYLPPEGYGHFYNFSYDVEEGVVDIKDDVQPVDILNGTLDGPYLPDDQCMWTRTKPPPHYKQKIKEEQARQKFDPDHSDPDLNDYRDQEWHRREYGVWFWNYNPFEKKAQLEYVIGPHYFYMNHWMLDTGYPGFRKKDQEYYFFRRYCEENPLCTGLLEATRRRAGKTYRGGEFVAEYTSRNEKAHGGVQSKTEKDAKINVFRKAVVEPFRKMIETFKPIYDKSKGERPTTELSFFNTNKKGEVLEDQEDALESWVDWASSDPISYDGHKLHRYLHDECFKRKDSVYELYDLIKPCFDDGNGRIIGKGLFTSTVEEMNEDAMRENVEFWLKSDQSDLNENGETTTGLFRFFVSALENFRVDKYGYADIEANRKYFQNIRNKLKSSPKKLAAHKRKFPWNWEEAFAVDGNKCLYDPIKLEDAITRLQAYGPNVVTRGKLDWIDRTDWTKGVEFKEKSNGNFVHCLDGDFDPDELNAFKVVGKKFKPLNLRAGVGGIDPFDHDDVKWGGGSMGAGAMFRRHQAKDPADYQFSDSFIMYYIGRPPKAKWFYEDMLKMCLYLGYRVLVEDNKPGILSFFEEHGAYDFLYILKGAKKPGISASPKSHKLLVECTEDHIEDGGTERCMFIEMPREWLKFEIDKTTKYDLSMADGWALVAHFDLSAKVTIADSKSKTSGGKVFSKHSLNGGASSGGRGTRDRGYLGRAPSKKEVA
jgi:hypothetical protein